MRGDCFCSRQVGRQTWEDSWRGARGGGKPATENKSEGGGSWLHSSGNNQRRRRGLVVVSFSGFFVFFEWLRFERRLGF